MERKMRGVSTKGPLTLMYFSLLFLPLWKKITKEWHFKYPIEVLLTVLARSKYTLLHTWLMPLSSLKLFLIAKSYHGMKSKIILWFWICNRCTNTYKYRIINQTKYESVTFFLSKGKLQNSWINCILCSDYVIHY